MIEWFNYIGLIIVILIMVPNIIYALKGKSMPSSFNNILLNILEQIGRYGSMIFMVFNIPYTYYGFYFDNGLIIYIVINSVFLFLYVLFWIIYWNKNTLTKAVMLSVLPTLIFMVSSILLANIPLGVTSILFGIGHISISIKNMI